MASLRDFLDRFRPVAPPGPAARAGVPVDRVAELESELSQVFAAIDVVLDQAEQLRNAAAEEAARTKAAAEEEARARVEHARERAPAERAAAAAGRRTVAEAERARLITQGEAEAARVKQVSEQRMSTFVDRVVADALSADASPRGAS
ncbi:MAG: hypothetical protein ACXVQ6_03690 [Actinomycetota bacterium]